MTAEEVTSATYIGRVGKPVYRRVEEGSLPDAEDVFDALCGIELPETLGTPGAVLIGPTTRILANARVMMPIWLAHYRERQRCKPITAGRAAHLDLHARYIDRYAAAVIPPPKPSAEELPYSYGDMVSLLVARFAQYIASTSRPSTGALQQEFHVGRHAAGFDVAVAALRGGDVRAPAPELRCGRIARPLTAFERKKA
ncbi:hypothetical protein [Nocardia donostiensis]|uniref:Uncharacterized protein n=1 Tax=Nocardia donostiensis TaxID=1538463 RepID=A0A1V2TDQ5_9NOCA|nr:hypothetical protein [Nocardia donostiensis]ONM47629.1 hypothetical protein B0T46_17205 [Nocardia donostiensis]OQS15026.1 hypothetical protein B0T36_10095 [Nocardia donostiensis]OQS24199.1 hypothetical protein B0T44_00830 [Nocardia donostiensis]